MIHIDPKTGILTKTLTFPYRIDRDSISRGYGYNKPLLLAEAFASCARELERAGFMSEDRLILMNDRAQWISTHDPLVFPNCEEAVFRHLERMEGELSEHAPEGTFFGTSEGDMTDFCFWTKTNDKEDDQ